MDIAILKAFFLWCTIINGALMIFSFIICSFGVDWVYRMHSRFYPISRDAFNVAIYSFMGLFKLFFFVFNLVPYIALVIAA